MDIPNIIPVGKSHNCFIIRTGAGFRDALKSYRDYVNFGKDELNINNPPACYPCMVTFNILYCGYHYIHCDWHHLNCLHEALKHDRPQHKRAPVGKLIDAAKAVVRRHK